MRAPAIALVLVAAAAEVAAAEDVEIEMEAEDARPDDDDDDEYDDEEEVTLEREAPAARPTRRRGRLYVRAGVLHVAPNAQSGEMVLSDVAGPATLAVENGPIEGSRADMAAATTGAVIVGYAIPRWGGELGVETILAPPPTFELRAAGTVAEESLAPTVLGTVPTGIPALGPELGRTKALTPVLTAVYRARRGKRVRPYVGAGASYLYTFDREITNATMTEVAEPRLEIDGAVSAVGQLGLDVRVAGRVHATVDVKAFSGFATTARVENIHMRTPAFPLYESVYVGTVSVDVLVRPVLVTVGAGTSF